MNIHPNIKLLRNQNKLTQEDVAAKLGIKRTNYGAYEEGRATPPIELIDRICDLYNVTFKELIGSELPPPDFITRYTTAPDNVRKAIDLLLTK